MEIVDKPYQSHIHLWLGILGIFIAFSAPLVQGLLVPWFKSTFEFPMDRFVSLLLFWIAMFLALGIAHIAEGSPLATFGFQRIKKIFRTQLIEWTLIALGKASFKVSDIRLSLVWLR